MVLARTDSDWLKHYLKVQGGALTISRQWLVVD